MSANLRDDKFDTETYDVGGQYHRQYGEESVEKETEEIAARVAYGHKMLQTDVPHSEQTAGQQRYHYRDHRALGIVAVVDVYSRLRRLVGCEQEGIEAVEYGMKLAQLPSLFEIGLDLVDLFF